MPRSIRVGPYRFTIRRRPEPWMRKDLAAEYFTASRCPNDPTDQTPSVRGLCWFTKQTIYVQSGLGPDASREVLIHELMHACWIDARLHGTASARHEEQVVGAMAPALLDLLQRNPALVRYLTERDT